MRRSIKAIGAAVLTAALIGTASADELNPGSSLQLDLLEAHIKADVAAHNRALYDRQLEQRIEALEHDRVNSAPMLTSVPPSQCLIPINTPTGWRFDPCKK